MVNPDMKEQRSPSMANYFQRRLAMKTPFPGEPEQSSEAEYIKSRKITLRAVDSSVINFTAAYFASTSAKETAPAQPIEAHLGQIKGIDKHVEHANRVGSRQ